MFGSKRNKELREQIDALKHELAELKQIIKTQELLRLRSENAALKEKEQLISKVHLHVKSYAFDEENNQYIVRYEVEPVVLNFTDEGELIKNEMFYAINFLRLIPVKEMGPLKESLDKAKAAQKGLK